MRFLPLAPARYLGLRPRMYSCHFPPVTRHCTHMQDRLQPVEARFDPLGQFFVGFDDEGHGEEFSGSASEICVGLPIACGATYGVYHLDQVAV